MAIVYRCKTRESTPIRKWSLEVPTSNMKFDPFLFQILLTFLRIHGLQTFVFRLGRSEPFLLLLDGILRTRKFLRAFIRVVSAIVVPWDVPSLRVWFAGTHAVNRIQPCYVPLGSRVPRCNSRSRGYERVWGSGSSRSPAGTSWVVINRCVEHRVGHRSRITLEGLVHIVKRRS